MEFPGKKPDTDVRHKGVSEQEMQCHQQLLKAQEHKLPERVSTNTFCSSPSEALCDSQPAEFH